MQEEASFFQTVFGWFKDNFEWFSWVAGGVGYVIWRAHRYFTGVNRVADDVAKLTNPDTGVMMKPDVESAIAPVILHIENSKERLARLEKTLDKLVLQLASSENKQK